MLAKNQLNGLDSLVGFLVFLDTVLLSHKFFNQNASEHLFCFHSHVTCICICDRSQDHRKAMLMINSCIPFFLFFAK